MVEHYRPATYDEALALLSEHSLKILGGGTDLMVKHRNWSQLTPTIEKGILLTSHLEELDYIDRQGHQVHIGSGVTLEEILDHFHTPMLLNDAIRLMASPAIRHTATLAGNIVNASPAGDSLPVLYLLDAIVVLESMNGMRHIPIGEFIVGPGKTSIQKHEMVKEVILTDHHFNHQSFRKVGGRQADAISKICFVGGALVKKHIIEDFRMSFGAVAATVVRKTEVEKMVIGKSIDWLHENNEKVMAAYAPYILPIDDQRSTAEYRKTVANNLMKDFMKL